MYWPADKNLKISLLLVWRSNNLFCMKGKIIPRIWDVFARAIKYVLSLLKISWLRCTLVLKNLKTILRVCGNV